MKLFNLFNSPNVSYNVIPTEHINITNIIEIIEISQKLPILFIYTTLKIIFISILKL